MPLFYDAVSLLYGLVATYTLVRLVKQRHSFIKQGVTEEDIHLAWMIAMFLLTPVGVLAHEAGHYLTAKFYGATNIEIHHRGYWGFVTYQPGPAFDATREIMVSVAGPGVGVLLGYISLALSVGMPMRMMFNHTLAFFGIVSVFHNIIGYPLIDLTSGLEGDFHSIYALSEMPEIVVAGIIHGLLISLLVVSWKRVGGHLKWNKLGLKKIVVKRNQL